MVSVQRHLAVLRSMLGPGESERLWVRAERAEQRHAGALLLTDRRLLFSGLGFVSQSQEAWPLPVVSGARATPEGLSLQVLGAPERFVGKPRDLERLAALLPAAAAAGSVADGTVADGLKRLVRLRDAGALTPEEFDAAKRRLLS